MRPVLLAILALLVCAAPASAGEQLLTLYSPAIESLPYVHRSEFVTLKADGKQAPAQAGSILGFQEMALVDSKRPDAKPLPVDKMMVHHFLYYAGGRVDRGPGGCLGDGFIGGRGEEHPSGRFDSAWPAELRARYGIRNATPEGGAPEWSLMTMVMNHYKRPKRFYVRTKVWYTTEPRQQVYPLTIGNCAHLANGMGYDVPGGGAPGSTFVDRSQWTVPFSGRILGGGSHHHGGALHQTLRSVSCGRTLFDAKAYYGADDHPYNTIRPILHEPGPIANGTFRTLQGIPVTAGEVLEREAVHSNEELHVAAMGFWATYFVRDDSVAQCGADAVGPARGHRAGASTTSARRTSSTGSSRSCSRRGASGARSTASRSPIGDQWFKSQRLTAKVGQKITWEFRGDEPHSVSVANGPRGFSSSYLGVTRGSYSFTPTVPGTYKLTCLIHPTTMSQTVKVAKRT